MKKILLGLLVIAMALALTACSQETYQKLAENMGKMSNNVYGIGANMSDVNNATEAVSASVSVQTDESGNVTGATIDFSAAAKITESVASIKDSEQKTEALKEELSKPVASSEAEQAAIQAALTGKKEELATTIAAIDTTGLNDGQKELISSIQETISSIQISENPTMAELTTVAVLSEMAATVQTVATSDTSVYYGEEGLTDEGLAVADSALSSLDTLKMTSEVAGMDLLGDVDIMALISSMSGGSKGINPEVLKYLAGFKAPIATIAKLVTNPETKKFDEAKYNSLVAQSKAIKMSYDLLSALYIKTPSVGAIDEFIVKEKTNHGLIVDDLIRYLVSVIFISIDKADGKAALAEFINEPGIYEALMDIENSGNAFDNTNVDGFGGIWNNLQTSFLAGQDENGPIFTPYALRSLSTIAILVVDSGYTDLLKLGDGDGTLTGYLSKLMK